MSRGMISSKFIKKTRVLGMLKAGRKASDIALAENITPATVYNWKRIFIRTGQLTLTEKKKSERGKRTPRCRCQKCGVQNCDRKRRLEDEQAVEAAKIAQASVRWREAQKESPRPPVETEESKTVLTAEEMRRYRQGLKS